MGLSDLSARTPVLMTVPIITPMASVATVNAADRYFC